MNPQPIVNSNLDLVGNLGQPPEPSKNTIPCSPDMAKSIAAAIAHNDARRLESEAEMDTPEGRQKAAKAAEAELAEKRQAWGARAWALPYDGFKGIPDSAEDKELKVYTRTRDHKHKFWGIKPVGMSIWDFWDIHDPEVKRDDDANQETPATPEPSTVDPPPINPPQQTRHTAKTRRRQKPSNVNPNHRVKKVTPPPKVNDKTRKSLAHKINAGNPGLDDQTRIVDRAIRAHDRPTRNKAAVPASEARQKTVKAKPSVQHNTPSQPKRKRSRPAVDAKPTERRSNQMNTPVVQGKARITKSSRKEPRPLAPSTHKMRTRRAGPAEPLQLP